MDKALQNFTERRGLGSFSWELLSRQSYVYSGSDYFPF